MVPRVSIGLPVYNGEKYLPVSLESLIVQECDDFELIISDNASTDRTEEICRSYAARDARVRYYRNGCNVGAAPNYRRVLELARGEYFKWVAHDDYYYPALLRRCLGTFEASTAAVVLVYGLCELIDEHGNVLGLASDRVELRDSRPYRRFAHVVRQVSHAYPLFGVVRTERLRRTRLTGIAPDWDACLLAELSLYGEFREIPEVLSQQRCHSGNAVALASGEEGSVAWDPSRATRRTRHILRQWTDAGYTHSRIWLPAHEERYWEYAKRVSQAPLPISEKARCYLSIVFLCYWLRLRKIGGRWRRRIIAGLRGRAVGERTRWRAQGD